MGTEDRISRSVLDKFIIRPRLETVQSLDISDEVYFSSEYSNYVSNSKLRLVNPDEGGSFITYLKGLKSTQSSSLSLGSAVHELLLQPNEFELSQQTKPSSKAGMMIDSIFKYRNQGFSIIKSIELASSDVDYYKSQLSEKRIKTLIKSGIKYYLYLIKTKNIKFDKEQIVLDEKSRDTCIKCNNSLRGNSEGMYLINPGEFTMDEIINTNEDTLVIDIEITFPNSLTDPNAELVTQVLKLKAKIDNWNININNLFVNLNDLKTTGKAWYLFPGSVVKETGEFIEGSFQHYHYYRQMAFYSYILKQYLKQKFGYDKEYKMNVNMFIVQTIPNYTSIVFKVPIKWIKIGLKEFKKLLCYAAYAEYNKDKLLGNG